MKSENITSGVTAFIDILGFGNRVLNSNSFDDIKKIENTVQMIRKSFNHDTDNQIILESQQISSIEILAFSDSVIVNVPLQSEATKYSGTFDAIMNEVTGFANAQGECVQNGFFIRGGVDTGWWYKDKSILISQSLTRAYKAEGDANYPIIVLTDNFTEYLTEHPDRNCYSSDTDPINLYLRKTKVKDKDVYYLNYIKICIEALDWKTSPEQIERYQNSDSDERNKISNQGYLENTEKWLILHSNQIKSAHAEADSKVKPKYKWLADYHNEIAPQYTSNENCLCLIE